MIICLSFQSVKVNRKSYTPLVKRSLFLKLANSKKMDAFNQPALSSLCEFNH